MQHDHFEFRVVWQACPHAQHRKHVLFIEAANEEAARAVAKDHIERHERIEWFTIHQCSTYLRPQGGRVTA
jgi:hypothetical protein